MLTCRVCTGCEALCLRKTKELLGAMPMYLLYAHGWCLMYAHGWCLIFTVRTLRLREWKGALDITHVLLNLTTHVLLNQGALETTHALLNLCSVRGGAEPPGRHCANRYWGDLPEK